MRPSTTNQNLVHAMPSYSDAEMRAIMGRALQIDSGRSERFTPEQLRTIAAELGISTQALEVAMYEADSNVIAPSPGHQHRPASRSNWVRNAAIAAGALLVMALGFASWRRAVNAPHLPRAEARAIQVVPVPTTRKTAPAVASPTEPSQATPTPAPTKVTTKRIRQ